MTLDKYQLMTGVDILIPGTNIYIHQPTALEISEFGEQRFFDILKLFSVDLQQIKDSYFDIEMREEDRDYLNSLDDKDFFSLAVMTIEGYLEAIGKFFLILNSKVKIGVEDKKKLVFIYEEEVYEGRDLLFTMRTVFKDMFNTSYFFPDSSDEKEFNPISEKAKKIVEKIQKRRETIRDKNPNKVTSFLSVIVSVLSTGSYSMTPTEINKLTIYRLLDQVERYKLFLAYQQSIKALMAGAKGVEITDWTKEL